jgi:hypothetical protein
LARHLDVEEDDVGLLLHGLCDGGRGVGRLGAHAEATVGFEDAPDVLTGRRVIVGDQNACDVSINRVDQEITLDRVRFRLAERLL